MTKDEMLKIVADYVKANGIKFNYASHVEGWAIHYDTCNGDLNPRTLEQLRIYKIGASVGKTYIEAKEMLNRLGGENARD